MTCPPPDIDAEARAAHVRLENARVTYASAESELIALEINCHACKRLIYVKEGRSY
jgi:hypothetical protein